MKVLVAGDYCPRDRVARKIRSGDTADMLASVKDTIAAVDYAIVNFECAVVEGNANPIDKCGPNLKCQPEAVNVLKDAGFHCHTLANNHFRDFGDEGVLTSLGYFKENGLEYVGGGENITAAEAVLYKKFDDGILAIINVCENEFSIASTKRAGSAPLDTVKVYHRIVEAREQADYVLVIVHGGHEHFQLPSPRMQELYRFFVEVGADAVINHHQHCYSGYEYYKGKPIVYGLGNFLFDHPKQRKSIWNEGYMAIIDFAEASVGLELVPYMQCDEDAKVRIMNESEKKKFHENIDRLNSIIANASKLEHEMNLFIEERKRAVFGVFTPYMNEYVRAAASRHWLPYALPRNKVLAMINYIACESQRDVTLGFFENYTGVEI